MPKCAQRVIVSFKIEKYFKCKGTYKSDVLRYTNNLAKHLFILNLFISKTKIDAMLNTKPMTIKVGMI